MMDYIDFLYLGWSVSQIISLVLSIVINKKYKKEQKPTKRLLFCNVLFGTLAAVFAGINLFWVMK